MPRQRAQAEPASNPEPTPEPGEAELTSEPEVAAASGPERESVAASGPEDTVKAETATTVGAAATTTAVAATTTAASTAPGSTTTPASTTPAATTTATAAEAEAGKPAAGPGDTVIDLDVPATAPAGPSRRVRVRFAHAVRRWPSPGATASAVRAWSRRPSGRLTLPALLLFALVAATGTAGALLIPATARESRTALPEATTSPPPQPTAPGFPTGPDGLPSGVPIPLSPGASAPPWNMAGGRPSDVLASWAARIGPRVGISPVAMQAYGYAELRLTQSTPGCQLRWTTLAAIGQVESGHGRANGATLGPNGISAPEIIGLPLDGNGGRMRIMDTEDGRVDRDATYDRAVGPMQFIPTTWEEVGADADGDGVENPHSIDDAALAAGNYLCKGGRNLSVAADWWNAILSYNDVRPYAQSVFDAANKFGTDSKT